MLKKIEAELMLYAGGISAHELDVCDEKSIASFADFCERQFGKIDLLFNCAGIAVCKEFESTSSAEFAQVLCAELVLHGISVSLVQSPDAL